MERKWWTLVVVCVAIFMFLLDITIVNVALPQIEGSLSASFSELQWVLDAYALTLATFVLTAGALADRFGRKRVFLAGILIFTIASALCGGSWSPVALIVFRGLQGVGGAIMFATSLAILSQEFHGKERGTAFGIWGATTGAAVALGPLVGGVLTTGLSWRWIFFVNIPIGAAAFALAVREVRESSDPQHARVDPLGFVLLTGGLFSLVFALIEGSKRGWSSTFILGLLAAAVALLGLFIIVQAVQTRSMVDLALFRKPAFVGAQVVAFVISGSMFAMFLYIVLYMQNILGYSSLGAGLRFLPMTMLIFLAAPIAGKLSAHVPVRLLLGAGLGLTALSLWLMSGIGDRSGWTTLLPGFIVGGIGIGFTNTPLASTSVSTVRQERAGMASGLNSTFRQLGIATGVAGLGAILQARVTSHALGALADLPNARSLARQFASGQVQHAISHLPADQRERAAAVARDSFVSGFNEILVIGAIVAAIGAVLALALVRPRDFVASGHPAADAA